MPRDKSLRKVFVLGSGPIVIGQAAEFDYAGTQCCRALREEGVSIVLLNSNPATIMTDPEMADRVYIEPMELEVVEKILRRERPDGVIGTMGGQTGLNLLEKGARAGLFQRYGTRILGTPVSAVSKSEDREAFRELLHGLGEPVPKSEVVRSVSDLASARAHLALPLVVRPAFTLGGTGGGIAFSQEELKEIVEQGLQKSMIHQVLLEESVLGWKEIEYEVMRDARGNKITICNMENLDPMGVHTGESIVVAPSQTLSDEEYQLLRTASLRIVEALDIQGGCNIQFALEPSKKQYVVIEVNPRLSRSSALASKATGYPIARVAAKIALGLTLDEIENAVTKKTKASFEPALDYVVTKIPRWPFDKFALADRKLGTQMKSTGEVMAIGRTLEESLLKALRSLDTGPQTLVHPELATLSSMELEEALAHPTDLRLFAVFEAFRRSWLAAEVAQLTGIDLFFLYKMQGLIEREQKLKKEEPLTRKALREYKRLGFSDAILARRTGKSEEALRRLRKRWGIDPVFKMVDTCAAEFEAKTPYFYSTYESEDEVRPQKRPALILGSGPIRIGQGIEFDYCTVHGILALQKLGYQAIVVNNNPETVSTDFDISSALYFEPLTLEDLLHILDREKPLWTLVQMGGQTAINLAEGLHRAQVPLAGTPFEGIEAAEDRRLFDELLERLQIHRPLGKGVRSLNEALAFAREIGFPLLLRPSFVLGGRAMEIVYSEEELAAYLQTAAKASPDHPVLIDRYILGKELEVDALCDGKRVYVPQIMEHIERAGIHSGDSMAVTPPQTLHPQEIAQVMALTKKMARALSIRGFINIQFVVNRGEVLVLEVNPRCSRTLPYLSKVLGEPLVQKGVFAMFGKPLSKAPPRKRRVGIKAPVFSFAKLKNVDAYLGPEMKSTGEVLGMDTNFPQALYKAFLASEIDLPKSGAVLFTLADRDKREGVKLAAKMAKIGYTILGTAGTTQFFQEHGLHCKKVKKISEGKPNLLDALASHNVVMLINTLSPDRNSEREGMCIRRAAVERNIPCITSLDTLGALLKVAGRAKAQLRVSAL